MLKTHLQEDDDEDDDDAPGTYGGVFILFLQRDSLFITGYDIYA